MGENFGRFFSVFMRKFPFQLNNGDDKKSREVATNGDKSKKNSKTKIYKRSFYESIYLGDLAPPLHSETAKAFQTNDWQDITLTDGSKIFEKMDAESIGDLEDLIKKYHVCIYVIKLTLALAESEKCRDHRDFMRMLEFVAKYIEDEKNGIEHSHATVKHHVSFNNSANIIIPSSARASMTTQSINLRHEDEESRSKFLCFPCHFIFLRNCFKKTFKEPEVTVDAPPDDENSEKTEETPKDPGGGGTETD